MFSSVVTFLLVAGLPATALRHAYSEQRAGLREPRSVNTTSITTTSTSSDGVSGDTSFHITASVRTETVTFDLTAGETETYHSDNDFTEGDSLTLVGPTTTTITQLITFDAVASPSVTAMTTSTPPWDPAFFRTYCDTELETTIISMNASISSRCSSFLSYGREPECSEAWSSFTATAGPETETDANVITTTLAGGQVSKTIIFETLTEQPFAAEGHCCWYCSLYYTDLRVHYWPATDANTGCLASATSTLATETGALKARDTETAKGVFATGDNGFIFTSPSVYVVFPLITAQDECGQVGSSITSLTLGFAPGELSTVSGALPGGGDAGPGTTVVFNPSDLPCGPNNGTADFLPDRPANFTGYLPIIALPTSKLFSLRPDWARCTNDRWQGQDPPVPLTPAAALLPAPTHDPTTAVPDPTTSAEPVPTAKAPVTATTLLPPKGTTTNDQTSPSKSAIPDTTPKKDPQPVKESDPVSVDPETPSSRQSPAGGNTQPRPSGSVQIDPSRQPAAGNTSPKAQVNAPSPTPDKITAGGFTFTPAPASTLAQPVDPQAVSPASPASPGPAAITIGGQTITPLANSSPAVVIHGQTFTAGQAPITIDNVPISWDGSSIFVNGEGTDAPTAGPPTSPALSPAPTPLEIDGTSLLPAGPAITISSTVLSLDASSHLIIDGSSTINIAQPTSHIVVASQTLDLAAGDIVVDGTTLTPGSAPITVGGKVVSLGSSVIVVGSQTVTYLPSGTTGSVDLGEVIYTAFGGEGAGPVTSTAVATGNSTTVPITGGATRMGVGSSTMCLLAIGLAAFVCIL